MTGQERELLRLTVQFDEAMSAARAAMSQLFVALPEQHPSKRLVQRMRDVLYADHINLDDPGGGCGFWNSGIVVGWMPRRRAKE